MLRYGSLVAGLALLAAAALVVVVARDVRRWPGAVRAGDVQLRLRPAAPDPWRAPDSLPFRPAARLVAVDDDLRFRQALRLYTLTTPGGRPPFVRGVRSRFVPPVDAAQYRLRAVARRDRDPRRRSAAANLLGVLIYENGGFSDPTYVARTRREFSTAVRLDPSNDEAKFNLELLLARSAAERSAGVQQSGGAGRRADADGAGATTPGKGY